VKDLWSFVMPSGVEEKMIERGRYWKRKDVGKRIFLGPNLERVRT
jgi:hypothetical protein